MGNEEMVLIGQVSRFDAWRFLVSLDTAMAPAVAKFTSDLFFFPDMVPDGFTSMPVKIITAVTNASGFTSRLLENVFVEESIDDRRLA